MKHWDIFCKVVDNYGDIGVSWRLARQLAAEQGLPVRLWVDELAAFVRLCPQWVAGSSQCEVNGVWVSQWTLSETVQPGQVVICAFGCDLPPSWLERMAAKTPPPLWINLEYLSAEDWVEGCHGLPSPHPRLPLRQYFFYPGFTPSTGGLLREAELTLRPAVQLPNYRLKISLFSYDQPFVVELLQCWAAHPQPVLCLVAPGVLNDRLAGWAGSRGALTVEEVPFVSQPEYDARLAACQLNFVRGEDSFVRAQWAQHPFVWQIYPQQEEAHRIKLEAFLARYLAGLDVPSTQAVRAFWHAWNVPAAGALAHTWPAFAAALPALQSHAERWAQQLFIQPDLASQLVSFAAHRVECGL
ncbi:MAG: elongation factor P maturation arginine rhamnosyltransferase EarP [Burkholderiaceae bacterium]|nr:MAG: elongation factor P maturation arginine rhamnosyltransferase EarP [Burkholderiaceae bacterium]